MSLNINEGGREREAGQREPLADNMAAGPGTEARPHINQHNHFFHFDGEAFHNHAESRPFTERWL